ncbi:MULTISPECIES: hypothetical protein [unclassified Luteococcus]|uniref:hypothetical protein n=1 Tax=unclassified Luteococcus TaxID=2639923 RepID=UPI00313D16A7
MGSQQDFPERTSDNMTPLWRAIMDATPRETDFTDESPVPLLLRGWYEIAPGVRFWCAYFVAAAVIDTRMTGLLHICDQARQWGFECESGVISASQLTDIEAFEIPDFTIGGAADIYRLSDEDLMAKLFDLPVTRLAI